MMKHIQTWLLITLLALFANGAVSAKLASGHQNLSGNLHQSQTVLNALLHQGLEEQVSTTTASGSPLATKGTIPKPPTGRGSVPPSERDPTRVFSRKQTADKLSEQGGNCAQCGQPKVLSEVDGHHVIRHADGGPTNSGNLAAVCKDCHKKLHKRPPKKE